jgi:thiamine-phosphate pyrophosphorylase
VKRPLARLHAVTDDGVLALVDFHARAQDICRAGSVALHLRSGSEAGRSLFRRAQLLKAACCIDHAASLFVNDRVDVAAATGADGIHLPTNGLPTAAARRVAGPDMWIGRSVHSPAEAQRAGDEGADYVFLGPIWPTSSHPGRAPLGLDAIARVREVNVIAIGGVSAARIQACLDAGAYGVAVVSALWHAAEPGREAQGMLLSLTA